MNEIRFSDLNLNRTLLEALAVMGLEKPTTIQARAFSVIMSGRDVCGIAQTGTGKTLAYLLPCIRQWTYSKERNPQILVLVPTRELAVQVTETAKQLTENTSFVAIAAFGGVNMKPQAAAIEEGCDLIVATPGRLLDLAYNGTLRLKSIKKLVIDEMDEMLNLGFRSQISKLFDMLPPKRQNLLFSATITPDVELVIDDWFNDPERIEAAPTGTPLQNITQLLYPVPNFYTKVNLLRWMLENDQSMLKVLIFTGTKSLADDLFEQLQEQFGEVAGVIHSNKEQNNRFNTVRQFNDGTYRFIIATDIVARGLDISEVSHVVNFDIPDTAENYVHRIGRTGRAEAKGMALSFMTEKEKPLMEAAEELMRYKVPEKEMPVDVAISELLTDDEKPKVAMRSSLIRLPDLKESGGAFHEKLAKNKKVNSKVSYKDKMKAKYGKPQKRSPKKK